MEGTVHSGEGPLGCHVLNPVGTTRKTQAEEGSTLQQIEALPPTTPGLKITTTPARDKVASSYESANEDHSESEEGGASLVWECQGTQPSPIPAIIPEQMQPAPREGGVPPGLTDCVGKRGNQTSTQQLL